MVTVRIDLPIFSTPTQSLGHFSGEVELTSMPRKEEAFPWPDDWLIDFREIFEAQTSQVWGVQQWAYAPPEFQVTLFGLVALDRNQAKELARHIEKVSGIPFEEH